jgi:PAS domain S-box-containing protein
MDIDRVLEYIAHPAIQLTPEGRVTRANAAACERLPWLREDAALGDIAPEALAARVAAAWSAPDPELFLDGFGARLLRMSGDHRLLLFDLPQVDLIDELRSGVLVWEYEGPELRSAGDLRLVVANAASEQVGRSLPLRSFLGRTREEIGPVGSLSPLYLQVARTREPAEAEIHDIHGNPFIARIFPLPGKRIGAVFEDVTMLRRTEQTFRAMFERSHEAILIFDGESETVLSANPAARDLYSPAGEELAGKTLPEIWRPYEPGLGARVLSEGFVRLETTHLRWDRELRLDIHALPVEWRGRASVMAILRDVSAEVHAMKALLVREEQYRSVLTNLPVAVWTIDSSGELVFVSAGPERIGGYTAEEIVEPGFRHRALSFVHPDDFPAVARAYEALFRDGTPFGVEYRFLGKTGIWKWLADHAVSPYEKDGQIFASGMTQDITERKQAEIQQLALAAFGRSALTSTGEKELMAEACRTAAEGLEVPMVNVLELDAAEDVFVAVATCGSASPAGFRIANQPDRLAWRALHGHTPILYSNPGEETRSPEDPLAKGARAGIAAPIRGRAASHGILSVKTGEPRAFSERDGAFVQSIANILAEAIERNRAERELERERAQLAEAQTIAHIGSVRVDLETQQLEWSDELYRIYGMEPHSREIDLDFAASRMSPESREHVWTVIERSRAGDVLDEEHVIHGLDGVTRVIHYRARTVTDRFTGRATIVGTVQDVTAAKQAELALREHERRLQVIASRLPVMLFSTDADLRLTSLTGEGFAPMSDSVLQSLSLTLDDVIGPEPAQGGPRAALAGRDMTYDVSHGERHLRVHIEPLRDEITDAVTGVVGIAFDATEEKRAADAKLVLLEQLHDAARQWRDTFDSIQAPILIVDEGMRVQRMNAAALRFSRFSEYQWALDQPLKSLGNSGIWGDVEELARTAAETRESVARQHTDDAGRVWDVMASSGPGQIIILLTEVTDVVRMQERLRRAELMSQMGALVAGVAHEVRNPLFGISATLDAFESKFGTELYQDYVSALREQVTRMSQLMHELLEYGRPIDSELRRGHPGNVLQQALESMEPLARQRGVSIRGDVPHPLPQIRMDRQRLLLVFENLLKNAIEHSGEGGEVQLRAAVSEDEAGLTVEVADRGPGIAAEDLPRVFEPFFTRRRGGTGLGLSLVRRIVDEHQGVVHAGDREGGGASMVVTLPLAEAARTE